MEETSQTNGGIKNKAMIHVSDGKWKFDDLKDTRAPQQPDTRAALKQGRFWRV